MGENLTLKRPRVVLALYSLGALAEKANMQLLTGAERLGGYYTNRYTNPSEIPLNIG